MHVCFGVRKSRIEEQQNKKVEEGRAERIEKNKIYEKSVLRGIFILTLPMTDIYEICLNMCVCSMFDFRKLFRTSK